MSGYLKSTWNCENLRSVLDRLLPKSSYSLSFMGDDAFSEMPGGRPPSFSRLISGGNRRSRLRDNAEGARIPRR